MTSTFVKVHDNLLDHPAWMDLDPVHVGVWTLVLGYCRRNKTDGHFPSRAAIKAGGTIDEVQQLVDAGRFHAPGHDCGDCPQPADGQLYLHAYLEHQSSREQQTELSRKRAEAGRRGGKSRAEKQSAKQTPSNGATNPSKGQPEGEGEREKDSPAPRAAAVAAEFESWWTVYPRKVGKSAATKAYAKARKVVDAETLATGLANALQVWRAAGTEAQFIPHPSTWLNEGRWADEPEVKLPGMPPDPANMRAVVRQCPDEEPHGRHEKADAHNRFVCLGVDA